MPGERPICLLSLPVKSKSFCDPRPRRKMYEKQHLQENCHFLPVYLAVRDLDVFEGPLFIFIMKNIITGCHQHHSFAS